MTESPSVSREVEKARRDDTWAWLQPYQDQFARILPQHIRPAAFLQLTASMMSRTADPNLRTAANANPESFVAALFDCARLGHDPGTNAYYLVPFGLDKDGRPTTKTEVVGIEGYRGIIQRMYRAGSVLAVRADVVRTGDGFEYQPGPLAIPRHEFDPFADDDDRGALKGAYAYALLPGPHGPVPSQVIIMGKKAIESRRKRSRGSNSPYSPWNTDEPSMWRKCPLRESEKFVPTSVEWRTTAREPAAGVTVEQITDDPRTITS
jgi:recombination protein RecT